MAADAGVAEGIRRLYAVKQRPASKPVAICVAKPADVSKYGDTSGLPPGLLERLLPGPVTVVLSRLEDSRLSEDLNPGVSTIGRPTLHLHLTSRNLQHNPPSLD